MLVMLKSKQKIVGGKPKMTYVTKNKHY